jgi:DNA-binding NarL/FixJ family response regulator
MATPMTPTAGHMAGQSVMHGLQNCRFVIVDDHPLFRGALAQVLTAAFKGAHIEEAGSYEALVPLLANGIEPDVVCLDLAMPGVQGLAGLMSLKAEYPALPVIIVSATDDALTVRRCLDCGASGYVSKSQPVEKIRQAVATVLAGGVSVPESLDASVAGDDTIRQVLVRLSTLTPQQLRVLGMLGEGLLNKQIAFKLNVSEATIKAHVSAILQKLGVDSRTQAVIAINKCGLGAWAGTSVAAAGDGGEA